MILTAPGSVHPPTRCQPRRDERTVGPEVLLKMVSPQMMALDQALAELEIPQPDPGRWAGQLAETSLELIHSVQHLWFIVAAPALFLPLGLVILGSAVLPRILGYLALVLAAGYALASVLTLLDLTVPPAVQISASIPALWWLAAAGTLLRRAREPS